MNALRPIVFIALLAPVLAGCGKELTAGGMREGDVSAYVTSDDDPQAERSGVAAPSYSVSGTSAIAAQIDVVARVSLLTEAGVEVPLHAQPASGSFRMEVADSALLVDTRVEAVTYAGVRLRFSSVQARVTGGLPVLDVFVDISSGPLTVDVPARVEVREGTRTVIVADLNAHTWLPTADPVTGRVSEAAFRSGVTVRVH